jgi:uncharacterized protein YndB with AHSA1/START domain
VTTDDGGRRTCTLAWSLDATPSEVFRAWTDPAHLDWYYNPAFPTPDEPIELDLRVGGVWRQRMMIDESTSFVTGGIYREIRPDERLVFAWGATDGWPELDPDRLDDSPNVTVMLSHDGDRTEMLVVIELPAGLPAEGVEEWWSRGIRDGWSDTVDRLAAVFAPARAAR